eukprot:476728-Rhodomonas_salina.1
MSLCAPCTCSALTGCIGPNGSMRWIPVLSGCMRDETRRNQTQTAATSVQNRRRTARSHF